MRKIEMATLNKNTNSIKNVGVDWTIPKNKRTKTKNVIYPIQSIIRVSIW